MLGKYIKKGTLLPYRANDGHVMGCQFHFIFVFILIFFQGREIRASGWLDTVQAVDVR